MIAIVAYRGLQQRNVVFCQYQLTSPCMMPGEGSAEQQNKHTVRDGHAPEVVPADGDFKASKAKPGRSAMKKSKSHGKIKAASKESEQAGGEVEGTARTSHRKSASPVFLSPTESLNSDTGLTSGRSNSPGQQGRESDGFADAASAAIAASSQSVKPVSSHAASKKKVPVSTELSSAALQSLEGAKGSTAGEASSRASAKSHSRSSSVAEWHDVELQSEAEDEAYHDKTAAIPHQSGPPPARGRAAGLAALAASDSDNDSELGIIEGEQHDQHVGASSVVTARGELLCCPCMHFPSEAWLLVSPSHAVPPGLLCKLEECTVSPVLSCQHVVTRLVTELVAVTKLCELFFYRSHIATVYLLDTTEMSP